MTLVISHTFVSAKGDGTDATLVRPSAWNAAHTTSMANNQILGNVSGGVGVIQEIPATPFALAALAATDGPSFLAALGLGGFSTGDAKYSINPTPSTGWIVYQGGAATIGDATSGASVRFNADCSNLFQMIWNQISSPTANAFCPVVGGLGANSAVDFANHKKITLPWYSGRDMIGAGAGSPLTTRVVGSYGGEETHVLLTAELAAHFHAAGISDPGHSHGYNVSGDGGGPFGVQGGGTFLSHVYNGESASTTGAAGTGILVNGGPNGNNNTYTAGSNTGHNTMQPYIPMWVHLKL